MATIRSPESYDHIHCKEPRAAGRRSVDGLVDRFSARAISGRIGVRVWRKADSERQTELDHCYAAPLLALNLNPYSGISRRRGDDLRYCVSRQTWVRERPLV